MKWASDAQRKWGHTESGKEALTKKEIAQADQASKGKKLPARIPMKPPKLKVRMS